MDPMYFESGERGSERGSEEKTGRNPLCATFFKAPQSIDPMHFESGERGSEEKEGETCLI